MKSYFYVKYNENASLTRMFNNIHPHKRNKSCRMLYINDCKCKYSRPFS